MEQVCNLLGKKTYQSPALTVVAFRAERGFVLSDPIGVPQAGMLELLMLEVGSNREETETFNTHETWLEGSEGFWQ